MSKFVINTTDERDFTIKLANALCDCTSIGGIFNYLVANKLSIKTLFCDDRVYIDSHAVTEKSKHNQTYISIVYVSVEDDEFNYINIIVKYLTKDNQNEYHFETIANTTFDVTA